MQQRVRGKTVAVTVCLIQVSISLAAAMVAGAKGGEQHAMAALYGGLVAIVPAAYMALRMFRAPPADAAPATFAIAFYRGEMGKMVLTALLFWLGVVLFAGEFLSLMSSYIASLFAYWLVMATMRLE